MSEPIDNGVLRWKVAIPATVLTALIQGIVGFSSFYTSKNDARDVVNSISELSHKVEIVAIKQESTDARFLALDAENRRLSDRIMQLERNSK